MMTKFFSLCTALICAASLYAQEVAVTTEVTAPEHGPMKCLMKSNAATWQAVGLTADKSKQAQAIADRCSKEHGMKAEGEKKEDKDDMMDSHVQELKTLLTGDEFMKWQNWCSQQGYDKDKNKSEKKY